MRHVLDGGVVGDERRGGEAPPAPVLATPVRMPRPGAGAPTPEEVRFIVACASLGAVRGEHAALALRTPDRT